MQVQPDGLALRYNFEDQQVYQTAPQLSDGSYASVFEGRHGITNTDGVNYFAEVALHLEAPITTDKALLI